MKAEGSMLYNPVLTTTFEADRAQSYLRARTAPRTRRGAIRALVLLAGTLRPTDLHLAIGRSVLDLPVRAGYSLGQLWCDEAAQLAFRVGTQRLELRILIDQRSPEPRRFRPAGSVDVTIERDQFELRGTGGLLRDLSRECDLDDVILACAGAQLPLEPLANIAERLLQSRGDVAMLAHRDGTPATFMALRCGCTECISPVGFQDMKEQALSLIARKHDVRVLQRSSQSAAAIRTAADYIEALRRYHAPGEAATEANAFEESWRPHFTIVECAGDVHPSARVHDSVVLAGAKVSAEAIVVRSLICPGAVVRRGMTVVDSLVK